jgi:hypothetical protein
VSLGGWQAGRRNRSSERNFFVAVDDLVEKL